MINDHSLGTKESCGMVQLLLAEVAEVYLFTSVPVGIIRLFWTMWGLSQVRNFGARVWGPRLPPVAAPTFYTDDATVWSRVAYAVQLTLASHCSFFCGLILPCPAQVESLRHAISIVILPLFKLRPFSVHRWERSLLDSTCKALCHRKMCFFFSEN